MAQNYTSANTSINSTKLPMVYTNKTAIEIIKGKKVLDVGGGKFDNAIEYCKTLGTELQVYDKYNRTEEHNSKVLVGQQYDVAIISNVLNVIDERCSRKDVVQLASVRADIVLITVYEGDGTGVGRPTKKDCWQENRKTESYIDEIKSFLGDKWNVTRKGKLIVCKWGE